MYCLKSGELPLLELTADDVFSAEIMVTRSSYTCYQFCSAVLCRYSTRYSPGDHLPEAVLLHPDHRARHRLRPRHRQQRSETLRGALQPLHPVRGRPQQSGQRGTVDI